MKSLLVLFSLLLLACGDGSDHDAGTACPTTAIPDGMTWSRLAGTWDGQPAEGWWLTAPVVPPSAPNQPEWRIERGCLSDGSRRVRLSGTITRTTLEARPATLVLEVIWAGRRSDTYTVQASMPVIGNPPIVTGITVDGLVFGVAHE